MAKTDLEFILHVIPPPMKLDWSTPRSLFLATFLNHVRKDKAPIGHLFVEFSLPKGAVNSLTSKYSSKLSAVMEGASRVITGMTRQKMSLVESLKLVQGKRLGLGSFYYDFKGKLDSSTEARDELKWAQVRGRHATIRVSITEEIAHKMMGFLHEWIERGSFRHYSGGLDVAIGEGAGCAEFGMHFLGMALGVRAIHPDWMRRVRVPNELIGGGFDGTHRRVSMWNILAQGDRWAFNSEEHRVYSIPDPELIFDWVKAREPSLKMSLAPGDVSWSGGEFVQSEFKVTYPQESVGSVQEQWMRVVEKN